MGVFHKHIAHRKKEKPRAKARRDRGRYCLQAGKETLYGHQIYNSISNNRCEWAKLSLPCQQQTREGPTQPPGQQLLWPAHRCGFSPLSSLLILRISFQNLKVQLCIYKKVLWIFFQHVKMFLDQLACQTAGSQSPTENFWRVEDTCFHIFFKSSI